jgi:hypothetical protein
VSENPHQKPDFLEAAKHQIAQIAAEFEKALAAIKDPERRKQMTASYLEMLQKGLSKAQESVAKYQEKIAPPTISEPPEDASATDAPATPEPTAAPPEPGPTRPGTPTS